MNNFPKIIHQIWMQGYRMIPDKYKDNIVKNKNINPDWTYKFWSELDILGLLQNYPDYLTTYYKFIYLHQKVDYARYVILYLYGGIYIDIDAYSIKNLNSLINKYQEYELLVSKIHMNYLESMIIPELNNGVIICKKNSRVLLDLINYIKKNPDCYVYQDKTLCIENTTGPNIFTKIINKYKNTKLVKILDYDYLEPCNLSVCRVTKNTYIKHEHEFSWNSIPIIKPLIIFYLNHKSLVYIIISIIILYFIYRYACKKDTQTSRKSD